ncbi:MAG TPA: nitroreductase family deazaflavin-dependent oxidoreductase [Ilumatobacteraceae bacterium]|nr:nitroreductase family deazaflavin-dependent oxidoreductase [Ilumatobacteraceae bacterium]
MNDWNAQIIAEFRATGGKAAQFGDSPLVILHTTGAKSGELREIPLVAFIEGDDLYVFASAAGSPKHPDWYYNLKANPEITVEFGVDTFEVIASELPTDEADAKLMQQAELMPQFADYIPKAAPRIIPAFRLTRAA